MHQRVVAEAQDQVVGAPTSVTVTPSTAVSIDEVLLALRSIPGIRSADIGDDETGGAGLLRLDLAADVDEVEVATSVGRLLRERFGLGVDAGQVQMVEAAADFARRAGRRRAGGVRRPHGGVRVTVMNVTSAGRKVTVSIVLRRGERECRGEAPGTTTANGVHRAVAEATLHAIEELTEDAVIGRLEHLEVSDATAARSHSCWTSTGSRSARLGRLTRAVGSPAGHRAGRAGSGTAAPAGRSRATDCSPPRWAGRRTSVSGSGCGAGRADQRLKASLTFSPACLMSPLACSTSPWPAGRGRRWPRRRAACPCRTAIATSS